VSLNADEIVPGLWQGAVPDFGPAVAQAGFDVLVLTASEHQRSPVYYPDVKVIQAPNDDSVGRPLTPHKLRTAARTAVEVARDVQQGKRVLVTCAAGMNRSGFVVALALHLLYGMSGEMAIQWVRFKRRRGHDGYRSLSNGEFNEVLRRLPTEPPKIPAPNMLVERAPRFLL